MEITDSIAREQAALWNGHAGHAWVENQTLLDHMFCPMETRLVESVQRVSGRCVLDVGCGTGSTTLAVARALGADGQCIGIDVSQRMIATACKRAQQEGSRATFICADAQDHAFAPAQFDTIISRMGVMFFSQPAAAFANLRRAGRQAATLHCIVWRSVEENPFMTIAERAAAPLLPNLPARKPHVPGQFAFADRQRVACILHEAGWTGIDIQPVDFNCTLPVAALADYATQLGPVGLALEAADMAARSHIAQAIRPAFDAYVHGAEVRFTAACWMIRATASSATTLVTHV